MAVHMRTKTPYDFPHLEELQRVSAKSVTKRSNLVLRTFLLGAGAFDVACGLLFASRGSLGLALFLCVMGTAMLVCGAMFYSVRTWIVSKVLGDPDFRNDFVLKEEELVVYAGDVEHRFSYNDWDVLLEAELSFYLLGMDKQGLMLDKANLTGGSVEDLRRFLETKCGKSALWAGKGTGK